MAITSDALGGRKNSSSFTATETALSDRILRRQRYSPPFSSSQVPFDSVSSDTSTGSAVCMGIGTSGAASSAARSRSINDWLSMYGSTTRSTADSGCRAAAGAAPRTTANAVRI
ncbi:MAG: hypothetical protein M0R80_27085 [Proteobacteria bacterium]|nr:hypothetical protein [Pseudomonadota bacterium]